MPYFSEGSGVYLIEDVIRRPELFNDIASTLVSRCTCAIIDTPFTAEIDVNGFVVERVVGTGSVVCSPGCKAPYRLASPAWGQGRVVKPGSKCLLHGGDEVYAQLVALGFSVEQVDFYQMVDAVTKRGMHGVAFLTDSSGIDVESEPGTCGTLGTPNPLHPAAAFGKPGIHTCVEKLYHLVGPLARLTTTILYIGEEKKPLITRLEGLGSGLLVHTDPATSSKHVQIATWLGVLYECGAPIEYMQ